MTRRSNSAASSGRRRGRRRSGCSTRLERGALGLARPRRRRRRPGSRTAGGSSRCGRGRRRFRRLAERGAVAVVAALLVGRAGADVVLQQIRWACRCRPGGEQGGSMASGRGRRRRDHLPAVGFEALRRVVGEPAFDVAVDGDAVVVVEGDQLAQARGAGQRAGFVRDAFHQAAVAEEDVGVVIDDGVAGAVELGGQHLLGQRHADGVGDALAERAGGGLDAGGVAVFRVARGLAVQLAEFFRSSIDRS
jgi:hypothetical protein